MKIKGNEKCEFYSIQLQCHSTSHSTQPNPWIDPTHVHLWRTCLAVEPTQFTPPHQIRQNSPVWVVSGVNWLQCRPTRITHRCKNTQRQALVKIHDFNPKTTISKLIDAYVRYNLRPKTHTLVRCSPPRDRSKLNYTWDRREIPLHDFRGTGNEPELL